MPKLSGAVLILDAILWDDWVIFFKNVILFRNVVHHKCDIFYMKLAQYNECLVSIVDTDDLVLQHQGISSHGADYAPMRFPVFKG